MNQQEQELLLYAVIGIVICIFSIYCILGFCEIIHLLCKFFGF